MSLIRAILLLAGVATLSACASFERGVEGVPLQATPITAPAPAPAPTIVPVNAVRPVELPPVTVHFEFAQDEIRASAMQILYGAAQAAKRGKPGLVRIRGFTDASGKRDFNLKLAQRRAKAVADQLRKLGVAARIEIAEPAIIVAGSGKAKKDPANRKVEITFETFPVTAVNQAPVEDMVGIAATDTPLPEAGLGIAPPSLPEKTAAVPSLHSIGQDGRVGPDTGFRYSASTVSMLI